MKRASLQKPHSHPNFVGSWILEPLSLCDEIINHFESNPTRHSESNTTGAHAPDAKDSVDLSIAPNELHLRENHVFEKYFQELFACYEDYKTQWPFISELSKELHIGKFNIQRYQQGQHFQRVHAERGSIDTLHRLFAWMTYLNDVSAEDGGATVFTHYDLSVQPQKGLTLIWPAEWTHAHKGSVLNTNSKYIITGWMHFPC